MEILINICCLFLGSMLGMGVLAMLSVNRCNDCGYHRAIYKEMDKETT